MLMPSFFILLNPFTAYQLRHPFPLLALPFSATLYVAGAIPVLLPPGYLLLRYFLMTFSWDAPTASLAAALAAAHAAALA